MSDATKADSKQNKERPSPLSLSQSPCSTGTIQADIASHRQVDVKIPPAPGSYLPLPQGVSAPYNCFDTPTPSPTGGVKISYNDLCYSPQKATYCSYITMSE